MLADLGLNLKEIIFVIINFLLLIGILGKFIYKPFLGALDNRKQAIQDSFDKAEAVNKRADAKMISYNRKIANADEEAREIIRDGKKKAEAQAELILAEANEKASEIIAKAEAAAEAERAKVMDELRQEIATIGMLVAEQIVEKQIEIDGQEAIVDNAIKRTSEAKWQS